MRAPALSLLTALLALATGACAKDAAQGAPSEAVAVAAAPVAAGAPQAEPEPTPEPDILPAPEPEPTPEPDTLPAPEPEPDPETEPLPPGDPLDTAARPSTPAPPVRPDRLTPATDTADRRPPPVDTADRRPPPIDAPDRRHDGAPGPVVSHTPGGPRPDAPVGSLINPSAGATSAFAGAGPRPGSAALGAPCSTDRDCASGLCEGPGCGPREGRCAARHRACTKDLRAYCGCDGETFEASGSCPGRRYAADHACRGPRLDLGAGSARPRAATAGASCSTDAECASGVCEGLGCGPGEGRCAAADRACTKDLRVYCGCDGRTFRASGSCPGRRYASPHACATTGPGRPPHDGLSGASALSPEQLAAQGCHAERDCVVWFRDSDGCRPTHPIAIHRNFRKQAATLFPPLDPRRPEPCASGPDLARRERERWTAVCEASRCEVVARPPRPERPR